MVQKNVKNIKISEVRMAVGSNPTSIILTAVTGESHTWAVGFL
jgi:hypothetical protein